MAMQVNNGKIVTDPAKFYGAVYEGADADRKALLSRAAKQLDLGMNATSPANADRALTLAAKTEMAAYN